MADREELLGMIRQKGPVLPVQIAKEIGTSILFASAMLSELVSAKLIKVSTVKIGGSPVYYIPEHASRLQDFSKHLPGKEQEAYSLLKEKKVLRDTAQEPAIRVALKNMRDFAWPLNATIGDKKELFWKWFLIENEEATDLIKSILGIKEQKESRKEEPEIVKQKDEPKKETEKNTEPKIQKTEKSAVDEQKEEIKPEEPQLAAPKQEIQDGFLASILGYFSKSNIKVLSKNIIKKNSEIDFDIELQSSVGCLRYYCKAKSKKRVNDGDLSSAYVQGHLRKLPVLFLSYGEPTKRAKEMLNKEFQNIVFKKI
jgi:hypothetical protein